MSITSVSPEFAQTFVNSEMSRITCQITWEIKKIKIKNIQG